MFFLQRRRKCKNGIFTEAAWYYTADCMEKTGNNSGAILQNQALIKRFPESTYVYNAAKNLVGLYRAEGKYSDALENANFLLEKYKEVFSRFSDQKLAEEALYRRGELFYGIQDFGAALERFSEYKNKCKSNSIPTRHKCMGQL